MRDVNLGDGETLKCICIKTLGEEKLFDLSSLFDTKMLPYIRGDESLKIISKVISVLHEFPDNGKIGISAKAYPSLGVVTIGFTDCLGEWDPLINYIIPEILSLTLTDIDQEIKAIINGI